MVEDTKIGYALKKLIKSILTKLIITYLNDYPEKEYIVNL